ncbi:TraR/DksA C4-type zinc finger protein [Micromonospora sp. NPDC050686]|uniref:TraR/DksA family transcriptional regulator n=1 Tax=Micromonospora sp. NPDC050686 TaxID=3154631 RepID=UPI0033D80DE3
MYAASRQDELGVLRIVLEDQYERHTTQLALLARQASGDGAGLEAASALAAASRRALSDIARALHYLEQGHYGTCVRCHRDIPIEQLALRPVVQFCVTCQAGTTPTPTTAGPSGLAPTLGSSPMDDDATSAGDASTASGGQLSLPCGDSTGRPEPKLQRQTSVKPA